MIFPAIGIGYGIVRRVTDLWADGIPVRDIFRSPERRTRGDETPLRRLEPKLPAPAAPTAAQAVLEAVPRDVLDGMYGPAVRDAFESRAKIRGMLARLPENERSLLPDLEPHLARRSEIDEAVLGNLGLERGALLFPVGDERVEADGIDHGTGKDVSANLRALFEHDDGNLLPVLGRKLAEADGRREAGRAGADHHHVELHAFTRWQLALLVAHRALSFDPFQCPSAVR